MMKINKCKICDSDKLITLKKYKIGETSDPMWNFIREMVLEKKERIDINLSLCLNCGFVFYEDIFDFKEIAKFYEIENRYGGIEKSSKKEGRKKELAKIFGFLEKTIDFSKITSIMDVGAGDFAVLERLMATYPDIDYSAIDPSYSSSQYGKARVFKLMIEDFEVKKTYDLILLIHILEHVAYFENFMPKVREMTDAGSRVYLEVPFQLGPGLFFNRAVSTQHINYFTPTSIRNLLSRYGLKIIAMDFDKTGFKYNGMPGMIRVLAEKNGKDPLKVKGGILGSIYYLLSPLIFIKSKLYFL